MIIANAVTAVSIPLSITDMRQATVNIMRAGIDPSLISITVICAIANIAFAVALFRWQKWGFYGFIAVSAIAFFINLSLEVNIFQSLFGLIEIPLLYWVLILVRKIRLGRTCDNLMERGIAARILTGEDAD